MTEQQPKTMDELGKTDGFRKRKTRPKGWYKQALKAGEIREPGTDAPVPDLPDDAVIFEVPVGRLTGEAKEPS